MNLQHSLTREELEEALTPVDKWVADREPADRLLDFLTFTPKPGDRDLLLWIAPCFGGVLTLYVLTHVILAAVTR